MHLLYLDDSGSAENADDKHIVLAGLAVFERVPYWFSKELDDIAKRINPDDYQDLEFRGVDIFSGRKRWRKVKRELREPAYIDALTILANSQHVNLFGAAIHKASISPEDPVEYAFEQLISRFDLFLNRLHKRGDTQRGIIVLDKTSRETKLQSLARDFRRDGHRWGELHNIAETPLFVDSQATRMIQFADLVARALRMYYERGVPKYLDGIAHRFDREGGVLHGLVHRVAPNAGCNCIICRQKAVRYTSP